MSEPIRTFVRLILEGVAREKGIKGFGTLVADAGSDVPVSPALDPAMPARHKLQSVLAVRRHRLPIEVDNAVNQLAAAVRAVQSAERLS